MVIHGLKSCDTCRKAAKALTAAGHPVRLRDLREEPPGPDEWKRFLDAFGEALLNRRSATWRGLDDAARAGDPVELLAAHPALMKRPVIEAAGRLHLGWDRQVQSVLLPS